MTELILAMKKSDIGMWVTLAVIMVIFAALMIMQTRRRKTQQTEYAGMLDTLRAGMRVKTVGGVIGRIKEIREEAPSFKTVLLETGDPKNPSLVLYDLQAIYGVVDDEAVAKANAEAIEKHEEPDKGVKESESSLEPKKTAPKRKNTK